MAEFLLVRHAKTDLNDPSNEKIRGYSDVPISYEGKKATEETRDFLRGLNLPVQRVVSSPLQRAIMTSSLISEAFGPAQVIPNKGLLPWNLGALSETPVITAIPQMDYLQEFSDIKAPKGESYRSFYARWTASLDMLMYYAEHHLDEILVAVTHSRNLLALPSVLGSRQIGDVPTKGGPEPSSVTKVYQDDSGSWTYKTIWNKPTESK